VAMQAGRPVGNIRQLRESSNHPGRRSFRMATACLALLLIVAAAVLLLFFAVEHAPWQQFAQATHLTPPKQDFSELFPHRRP
jgi:hypothetical protein